MLANRLRKRQRHLRKWARRNDITCYRLYERDIPEFPLIVDWYGDGKGSGEAVAWLYERKRDETPEQADAQRELTLNEICEGLDLTRDQLFVKERARQRGRDTQYERLDQSGHVHIVAEQGLRFEVNLGDYLDTGLFLDHRNTRALVRERAAGQRVLNLFAYTGSFTCYALDGGARATTTVDLSKTYCEWARRNVEHNGFGDRLAQPTHQIVQADCLDFLTAEIDRGVGYDLIVCDPPTFSNSKRMASSSFDVVRDHPALIGDCVELLNDGGALYFSTNARGFALETAQLPDGLTIEELTPQSIPEDFRNRRIHQCWRLVKS